jgi:hypothetical protein
MESKNQRPETGPMEFPGDWPGIFIRGDNAFMFTMAIDVVLNDMDAMIDERGERSTRRFDIIQMNILRGLGKLLAGCDTRTNPTTQKVQLIEE